MGTLVITPLEKHEVVQPGSLKIVHTMGLPQRFSGHIKGHLYIVMDVKLPLSRTLSSQQIASFKQILPNTNIDSDADDEEEESKTSSNSNSNSVPNGNGNQPQKKRKNSKSKPNKRHKNNKRNKGKKNNKKNKKNKGMFGGLHGAFGGGDAKTNGKMDE